MILMIVHFKMKNQRTKRQKEAIEKLSKENDKLRWLCIGQPFKCKLFTLQLGWYERTGTSKVNGSWVHDVKLRGTKKNITISDADYLKAITNFKELNKHL